MNPPKTIINGYVEIEIERRRDTDRNRYAEIEIERERERAIVNSDGRSPLTILICFSGTLVWILRDSSQDYKGL